MLSVTLLLFGLLGATYAVYTALLMEEEEDEEEDKEQEEEEKEEDGGMLFLLHFILEDEREAGWSRGKDKKLC